MFKTVIRNDGTKTLLEILREKGVYIPAPCGGRGTCGKCRVKILEGQAEISAEDKAFFSERELKEGYRLSCKLIPTGELTVCDSRYLSCSSPGFSEAGDEEMHVLGIRTGAAVEMSADKAADMVSGDNQCCGGSRSFVIGIDIGTTTIAMALSDLETGEILDEYLSVNKQRMYGADVISRIKASMDGGRNGLQNQIRQSLWEGIKSLTKNGSIMPKKVIIAANTTMTHLLMGYPCETLGVYPYTPYNIKEINGSLYKIFGEYGGEKSKTEKDCRYGKEGRISEEYGKAETLNNVPVTILPGISAFVGADIVAGLLACGFSRSIDFSADNGEEINMFIDLGTNGEMAIGGGSVSGSQAGGDRAIGDGRILVASTAAGPAFESGNMTYGSSALDIIYELLQKGIIDNTGYTEQEKVRINTDINVSGKNGGEDTGQNGGIYIYRKDIRELQLAKAAIRAGIEVLLLRYGITAKEVKNVYIAGGFGYHINIDGAIGIGLFPKEFKDKIKIAGNASLKGALLYSSLKAETAEKIVSAAKEVSLASDEDFNRLYLEYMYF